MKFIEPAGYKAINAKREAKFKQYEFYPPERAQLKKWCELWGVKYRRWMPKWLIRKILISKQIKDTRSLLKEWRGFVTTEPNFLSVGFTLDAGKTKQDPSYTGQK